MTSPIRTLKAILRNIKIRGQKDQISTIFNTIDIIAMQSTSPHKFFIKERIDLSYN